LKQDQFYACIYFRVQNAENLDIAKAFKILIFWMFKLFLPSAKLCTLPFQRNLCNISKAWFSAAAAKTPETKSRFPLPPQREPLPEGHEQSRMKIPQNLYLDLLGTLFPSIYLRNR